MRSLTRRRILIGLLALVLMAVATTYAFFRRDLNEARALISNGSTILQTSCGEIEYAEAGSGPPVLSLHGTGGGWDQGLFIARGLVARGFTVISPSRYGYLRTPMPENPSAQGEADLHACFLDALGIDRLPVIAASAGATPALQLALRHPTRVSSLVLLVPAIGGIGGPPEADAVSPFIMNVVLGSDFPFWAAMKVWPRLTLTVVAVPASIVPDLALEDRKNLDAAMAGILPVTLRRKGILYDAHNQNTEPRYPLDRITVPTLLISAADDLYETLPNARAAASAIPGARLIEFRSGGHLLLGHDAEIWPAIAGFIAGGRHEPGIRH